MKSEHDVSLRNLESSLLAKMQHELDNLVSLRPIPWLSPQALAHLYLKHSHDPLFLAVILQCDCWDRVHATREYQLGPLTIP